MSQDAIMFWSWLQRVIMIYHHLLVHNEHSRSEVDSNESLWYKCLGVWRCYYSVLKLTPTSHYDIFTVLRVTRAKRVLKLTPTSHYDIEFRVEKKTCASSEVDSNESLWYRNARASPRSRTVLKLTPTSHYDIQQKAWWCCCFCSEVDSNESLWYNQPRAPHSLWTFWSWLQRVIMI